MKERSGPVHGNRAVRLTIEYEGRQLRIVSRQTVQMVAPPSDPVRGYEGQSGFWYEVRGAKGEVLYRRVTASPIGADVEAHDPETGSRRYPIAKPRGVFVALVPDLEDAERLVIMSSPTEAEKVMAPAERLIEFPMSDQQRKR